MKITGLALVFFFLILGMNFCLGEVVHDISGKRYYVNEYEGKYKNVMVITDENSGKLGTMDISGKLVIPVVYDFLRRMDKVYDYNLVACKNMKCGVISDDESVKIPLVYDDIQMYEYGWFFVKVNGKYGLVDKNNKILIPAQYDLILAPSKLSYPPKYFPVVKGNMLGVIDYNNRIIVPLQAREIEYNAGKNAFEVYETGQSIYYSLSGHRWVEKW